MGILKLITQSGFGFFKLLRAPRSQFFIYKLGPEQWLETCFNPFYPGPGFSRESFQATHFVDSGPAFCREKIPGPLLNGWLQPHLPKSKGDTFPTNSSQRSIRSSTCKKKSPIFSIFFPHFSSPILFLDFEVLMQGGRLGCSSGLGRVLEDLPRLRPTTFAASPSFWNGLHKDFENQLRGDRGDRGDDRWGMGGDFEGNF